MSVEFSGVANGRQFVYSGGSLKLVCSPGEAAAIAASLPEEESNLEVNTAALLDVKLTGVIPTWTEAECGQYGPHSTTATLAAVPGGSADAATREGAAEGPVGPEAASSAQPPGPGHQADNVVPIKREPDELPPELARSNTLKPVVAWYHAKGLTAEQMVEKLKGHPAAKRVQDLVERVGVLLSMVSDEPGGRA